MFDEIQQFQLINNSPFVLTCGPLMVLARDGIGKCAAVMSLETERSH